MQRRSRKRKARYTLLSTLAVLGVLVAAGTGGAYLYFQNHFWPGTTFLGKNLSFASLADAKKVFAETQKQGIVFELQTKGKTTKNLRVSGIYQPLTDSDYQKLRKDKRLKPVLNPNLKSTIETDIAALNLNAQATNSQPGTISYDAGQGVFTTTAGKTGTVVDLASLAKLVNDDIASKKSSQYQVELTKLYQASEVSDKLLALKTALNRPQNGIELTLNANDSKVELSKADLANFLQNNGSLNQSALQDWLTNTAAPKLQSLTKPIYWKNPSNGHIYSFINNQDYGTFLDVAGTAAQISTTLAAAKTGLSLTPKMKSTFAAAGTNLEGFSVAHPIQSTFVWVDTDTQQAELWVNGQQIQFSGSATNSAQVADPNGQNDTPKGSVTETLTGFWDKGQATPSGFTTMDWKTAKIQMSGWEPQMNGGKGGKYSVPIQYADCLVFRPFDSPSTGNHEAPYETGIFIHQSEEADGSGVKPDAWFDQYQGWQAIKNAPVGISSNGCIGLPASTAKVFYDHLSQGFPVIITGSVYDSAGNEKSEGFTGYDKPHDNGTLVK